MVFLLQDVDRLGIVQIDVGQLIPEVVGRSQAVTVKATDVDVELVRILGGQRRDVVFQRVEVRTSEEPAKGSFKALFDQHCIHRLCRNVLQVGFLRAESPGDRASEDETAVK